MKKFAAFCLSGQGYFLVFSCMFVTALSSGCGHRKTLGPQRGLDQVESLSLPYETRWAPLKEAVRTLDLSAPETALLPSSGGTSVYAVIKKGKKIIGAILPENSATVLSGELFSFSLARALGVSDLYQPAVYHFLTGPNLQKFKDLVLKMETKGKNKAENKARVLKDIADHPQGIHSIFKEFGTKPRDYDVLVRPKENTLSEDHALPGSASSVARLLDCKGPQPNPGVTVTLNGGRTTEQLALKQLSAIFLIDALLGQWDRFSGGNLQTLTENETVKFISFDNGGTWGSKTKTAQFLKLTTRFDRDVAAGILRLDRFLNHGAADYYGLKTEDEFTRAFGVEKFPEIMPKFKKNLALVAIHLSNLDGCFFN